MSVEICENVTESVRNTIIREQTLFYTEGWVEPGYRNPSVTIMRTINNFLCDGSRKCKSSNSSNKVFTMAIMCANMYTDYIW